MRIIHISDTHSKHHLINWTSDLSNADMIIHSGDFTNVGEEKDLISFFDWFSKLPCKYKVCIAGNHDKSLDEKFWYDKALLHDGHRNKIKGCEVWAPEIIKNFNAVENQYYLNHEAVTIEGIKIFGSPWSAAFHADYWAFNALKNGIIAQKLYDQIPDDTGILITHGPSFGNLDRTMTGINCGDEILLEKILKIKPKFCLTGHIHEEYGQKTVDGITFINSSIMTLGYEPINLPQIFEI